MGLHSTTKVIPAKPGTSDTGRDLPAGGKGKLTVNPSVSISKVLSEYPTISKDKILTGVIFISFVKKIINNLGSKYDTTSGRGESYLSIAKRFSNYFNGEKGEIKLKSSRSQLITLLDLAMDLEMDAELEQFKKILKNGVKNEFAKVNTDDVVLGEILADIVRKHEFYYNTVKNTGKKKADYWSECMDLSFSEIVEQYNAAKNTTVGYFQTALSIKNFTPKIQTGEGIEYNPDNMEFNLIKAGLDLYSVHFGKDGEHYLTFGVSEKIQIINIFSPEGKIIHSFRVNLDDKPHYKKKHLVFDMDAGELLIQYRNIVRKHSLGTKDRTPNTNYGDEIEYIDFSFNNNLGLRVGNSRSSGKGFVMIDYLPWSQVKAKSKIESKSMKDHIESFCYLPVDSEIESAEFSPDGTQLIIIGKAVKTTINSNEYDVSYLYIYDIKDYEQQITKMLSALGEYEKELLSSGKSKDEIQLEYENMKQKFIKHLKLNMLHKKPMLGRITASAISSDSKTLAITTSHGIKIFDTKTGEALKIGEKDKILINCVCISPDGKNIFIGLDNGIIAIFNTEKKEIKQINLREKFQTQSKKGVDPLSRTIKEIAIFPDGKTIFVGFGDNEMVKITIK